MGGECLVIDWILYKFHIYLTWIQVVAKPLFQIRTNPALSMMQGWNGKKKFLWISGSRLERQIQSTKFAIYHSAKILPIGLNVEPQSSIQFLLQKLDRQWHKDRTSFCMQFEKIGRGLLREAFQSEGECFVSRKRGGEGHCLTSFRKKTVYVLLPSLALGSNFD